MTTEHAQGHFAAHYSAEATSQPDHLDAFWMPFTANRQFKHRPRLLAGAEGMYYKSVDGREILDGTGGLWCCNAGHARRRIVDAVSQQIATMDFAPTFQMGHPLPFKVAQRLAEIAPDPLKHVFFTNSGSESVDTALKIAIAWHRVRGEGQRTRLIGREKGYHGVGFGGISVGGLPNNRKFFGALLPGTDHLRHTLDLSRNAFSRGLPQHGLELAEDLERLVALHDASTIAAVIIEPIAGSAGVVLPPEGYLQRIREICDKHGILLIFDEVITGFGRVGMPFAAQRFGVTPDLITTAKGLTNGAIPMGAVLVSNQIFDAFMHGPEGAIELFHGYTYSGHPVACAAALAALDIYREEELFDKAIQLGQYWEDALHALKGLPNVIDIRNFGLIGAIELSSRPGAIGARAYEVFTRCFHDKDLLIRTTGDVIALSPPLIIEKAHIDAIFRGLGGAIRKAVGVWFPSPLLGGEGGPQGRMRGATAETSAPSAPPLTRRLRRHPLPASGAREPSSATPTMSNDSAHPKTTDLAFTRQSPYGSLAEPTYSGALSFLRRRYSKDLAGIDVAVVGVPFDLATTNRPGTRFGPRAIRAASASLAWCGPYAWSIDPCEALNIIDWGDVYFDPGQPELVPAVIEAQFAAFASAGITVLALGGDHFISYPILRALHARRGAPLALIHFDAHSDTWADEGPRIDHGSMFFHAAHEGLVDPSHSIQLGMRTKNPQTHGYQVLDARWLHRHGVDAAVAAIRARVRTQPCYLSFDVDFLDPAHAPGTGTPVVGGFSTHQALELIRGLAGLDIVGMDVVEVSPPYDHAEITALAAASVAQEMLAALAQRVAAGDR